MDFILKIFIFVLKVLIAIGDKTIEIFQFLANISKKTKTRKKSKTVKPIKVFPLPITIKLKYLAIGTFFSLFFVFIPLVIMIFIQDLPNPKH